MAVIDKMIDLFQRHAEYFGCDSEDSLDCQVDFENEFKHLICEHRGHDIGPDQCGNTEHDYCYRCGRLRTKIESDEGSN